MTPASLARKMLREFVKIRQPDGTHMFGQVLGTQYRCTDCRVRLSGGRERWIPLGKLRFTDPATAVAVSIFLAKKTHKG